jgi:tetratricopeptide (TPR) repeat protein
MSIRARAIHSAAVLLAVAACSRRAAELSPDVYAGAVTAFYTGLSAMQTTQEGLAREQFDRVIVLAPQEPAAWADRGLLELRQQDLDKAWQDLAKAGELAPDNAAIQRLQALAQGRRGDLADAVAHWRRALELDPTDLEAAYSLALETERQGGAGRDAEAQRLLAELVGRSGNLAARIELVRLAAKRGDRAAMKQAAAPLAEASRAWSAAARDQVNGLAAAIDADPSGTATRVAFLKNVLLREPAFRAALAQVSTPREEVGRPLVRFVVLKNPDPQPAAADTAMTFAVEPLADRPRDASWVAAVSLDGEARPSVVSSPEGCPGITSGAAVDLNADFRLDLAGVGPSGVCLLRQAENGSFANVTARAKLPPAIEHLAAISVWPADVDTDGDLDLVVAPRDGHPVVLRNNADDTFTPQDPFPSVSRPRAFVWADVNGDGLPDAAFADGEGAVHVFINLRAGSFREETPPRSPASIAVALAAVQRRGDALFDLLVLARDGRITQLARFAGSWTERGVASAGATAQPSRLFVADLDNNGAADLVVTGARQTTVLQPTADGTYTALPAAVDAFAAQAIADLDGDGRLDLVGLTPEGRPARAVNHGTKSYHWLDLHPRATTATGDQRINTFGIGGEVEVRSGLHLQKRVIDASGLHFGLGDAAQAEIVRITWPNGVLQAEFNAKADQVVKATQRLKGSCPWLFAWNGREMAFVTDLIWRSPLGLRINAQATADVAMTEDRVKIRGDQLAARDGAYDLRVSAELWEAHFFDLVSLLVVDHPAGTEVFLDERFATPPPVQTPVVTGPVQPFAWVHDDRGGDVSAVAARRDSRYVDFAGRGPYQGITRRHYIELELPDTAPRRGPLWLVAQGWVHPTDSSINVAISQGHHAAPEGLSLHVADAGGRFHEVRKGLGFPSGKDKTILIDLGRVFPASGARRLRLATNLEIYWDRLGWAVGRPDIAVTPMPMPLLSADLAYRGYSVTEQPSASAPERPTYRLASTAPRWLDLEGYYTRFGDVRELLAGVDDRYVIMNAGDELRLRFGQAAAPAAGLVRDFVLVGDGWVKDGDYNTSFSRTVLPLPTHASGRYDAAPRSLEDDPVYRAHPRDFAEYHTRYVTPEPVREALTTIK